MSKKLKKHPGQTVGVCSSNFLVLQRLVACEIERQQYCFKDTYRKIPESYTLLSVNAIALCHCIVSQFLIGIAKLRDPCVR